MSGESKRDPGRRRPSSRRSKFVRYAWVALVLAGGGGVAWAAADEVVVKVKAASVMSGKSGLSGTVATVSENDRLTVLSREGTWLRVKTPGGQEGYVKEVALTKVALSAGGRPVGRADTSGAAAGNAGKGLEKDAQDFATQQHISDRTVDDVNRMIALRKSLASSGEFERFQRDGRVGSGRP